MGEKEGWVGVLAMGWLTEREGTYECGMHSIVVDRHTLSDNDGDALLASDW